jgi:hypothetical protein
MRRQNERIRPGEPESGERELDRADVGVDAHALGAQPFGQQRPDAKIHRVTRRQHDNTPSRIQQAFDFLGKLCGIALEHNPLGGMLG